MPKERGGTVEACVEAFGVHGGVWLYQLAATPTGAAVGGEHPSFGAWSVVAASPTRCRAVADAPQGGANRQHVHEAPQLAAVATHAEDGSQRAVFAANVDKVGHHFVIPAGPNATWAQTRRC